ncbi:MAG: hypothetical protein ACE5KH_01655, partial [Candidatus Geothermarchaeales archaeon]
YGICDEDYAGGLALPDDDSEVSLTQQEELVVKQDLILLVSKRWFWAGRGWNTRLGEPQAVSAEPCTRSPPSKL